MSSLFARLVAMIGAVLVLMRRSSERGNAPAFGDAPSIPLAKPQGLPTLKLPTARGWDPDQTPKAAAGLEVNAFARDLDHPRWIHVLPNGDVLVAEAQPEPGTAKSLFDHAMQATLKRAGARGISANRISLFRDEDGDGVADVREVFLREPEPALRHGDGRMAGSMSATPMASSLSTMLTACLELKGLARNWSTSSRAVIGPGACC